MCARATRSHDGASRPVSAPRRATRHEDDDPFGELGSDGDAALPLSIRKESHDAELYELAGQDFGW